MKKLNAEKAVELVEKLREKNRNEFIDQKMSEDSFLKGHHLTSASYHDALVGREEVLRAVLRGEPIDKYFEGLQ
jgi:hypothetical protein